MILILIHLWIRFPANKGKMLETNVIRLNQPRKFFEENAKIRLPQVFHNISPRKTVFKWNYFLKSNKKWKRRMKHYYGFLINSFISKTRG
jgi:hypothetical protein